MMIFETEFSTYEVDDDQPRIRRLGSVHDPTPRQGEDLTWKDYVELSVITVGHRVLIVWRINEERGVLESTLTSEVTRVSDG
jgi:hypothetical protein